MIDPAEWLEFSFSLFEADDAAANEAGRRRCVSTLYYALFHKVLRAAAMRFMGPGHERTAGYQLLYRSFQHGAMSTACRQLDRGRFNTTVGLRLVSQPTRDFARAFANLQEARQSADYDPTFVLTRLGVLEFIVSTQDAFAAFDQILPDEQADILALMMVRARG